MATLLFKNNGLQSLLNLTLQAKTFRRSLAEAIKAYEKDTGYRYQFDQNISLKPYRETNRPTLWLVKDSGIYLMTSAYLDPFPGDDSHICYADGFAPTNPDWYNKSKEAVGGDDFVETIPFDNVLQKGIRGGADILIDITGDHFTIQLAYH